MGADMQMTVSCNPRTSSIVCKVLLRYFEELPMAGPTGVPSLAPSTHRHVDAAFEQMKHGIREDDGVCGTIEHVAASCCRGVSGSVGARTRSATDHHLHHHHHSKSIWTGAADLHGAANGGGG